MVDIATRVWNHKWKIDPIVRSLIDTDFYKLLMCQSVFRNRRDTTVTFSLINRTKSIRLAEIIEASDSIVVFKDPDLRYLMVNQAYLDLTGVQRLFGRPVDGQANVLVGAALGLGQQRLVAPEAVDKEPLYHRRIVRVDDRARADDLRDHPAPVDVADQHHRCWGFGVVAVPQQSRSGY